MKCPRCGGASRQFSNDNGRRGRKCGSCGAFFYTVELVESEANRLGTAALARLVDNMKMMQARAVLREKGILK